MPELSKSIFHLKPTAELITTRVLVSAGLAATTVGVSLFFLDLGLTESQVGLFTGTVSLITAALSLFLPSILERFNQIKLLIISTALSALAFILFGLIGQIAVAMLLFFFASVSSHISISSIGILFKDLSRTKLEFRQNTGLFGSLANLSWILGPLMGGLMLNYAGFSGLFLLSGTLILLGAVYVLIFPFNTITKHRSMIDSKLKDNLKFYISKPTLLIAYVQQTGVYVWWGFMWTFLPIFMLRDGYSESSIGFFVALTQLPLFLFEFKTVSFIPKFGYRKIFSSAFFFLALMAIIAFAAQSFIVGLGALVIASLALSFLEPITELYFFDQVSSLEEERAYPFYVTSRMTGGVLAKLGVGLVLALFADKFAFLLIALFMACAALIALNIQHTVDK